MKADGLSPIGFADKDGWPAMGTFDQLNMRLNGYDFHINLMAYKESWTDPKVKAVFDLWKGLLPLAPGGRQRAYLAGGRAGPRGQEVRHVPAGQLRGAAVHRCRPGRPRLLRLPRGGLQRSVRVRSRRRSTAS